MHRIMRRHLLINHSKHLFHNTEQTSSSIELKTLRTLQPRIGTLQIFIQLLHKLVENEHVHDAKNDEKSSWYWRSNNASDLTVFVKFISNCGCSGCNYRWGDDDNTTKVSVCCFPSDGGMTNVECPREKNVPIVTGFWPFATNLRVVRSIAYKY